MDEGRHFRVESSRLFHLSPVRGFLICYDLADPAQAAPDCPPASVRAPGGDVRQRHDRVRPARASVRSLEQVAALPVRAPQGSRLLTIDVAMPARPRVVGTPRASLRVRPTTRARGRCRTPSHGHLAAHRSRADVAGVTRTACQSKRGWCSDVCDPATRWTRGRRRRFQGGSLVEPDRPGHLAQPVIGGWPWRSPDRPAGGAELAGRAVRPGPFRHRERRPPGT